MGYRQRAEALGCSVENARVCRLPVEQSIEDPDAKEKCSP